MATDEDQLIETLSEIQKMRRYWPESQNAVDLLEEQAIPLRKSILSHQKDLENNNDLLRKEFISLLTVARNVSEELSFDLLIGAALSADETSQALNASE